MNTPVPAEPGRIRARIHDRALRCVTRMYCASLDDIFTDRFHDPDVNFHGLTIEGRDGAGNPVDGVCRYPGLPGPRTGPARSREPVQTPFLEKMKEAARLAIYRAMARDPDPRPAFVDWKRAADTGIGISPPPAELLPWRPSVADADDWWDGPGPEPVGDNAVLIACSGEPPEEQAFWQAAKRNGLAERIYETDHRLVGYEWYDRLPRITGMGFQVSLEGRTYSPEAYPVPDGDHEAALPERPDGTFIGLQILSGSDTDTVRSGPVEPAYFLASEIAFTGPAWSRVDDALLLVSWNSGMEPRELADLLEAAYFCPSDDSDGKARRAIIAGIVEQEILWRPPKGWMWRSISMIDGSRSVWWTGHRRAGHEAVDRRWPRPVEVYKS